MMAEVNNANDALCTRTSMGATRLGIEAQRCLLAMSSPSSSLSPPPIHDFFSKASSPYLRKTCVTPDPAFVYSRISTVDAWMVAGTVWSH